MAMPIEDPFFYPGLYRPASMLEPAAHFLPAGAGMTPEQQTFAKQQDLAAVEGVALRAQKSVEMLAQVVKNDILTLQAHVQYLQGQMHAKVDRHELHQAENRRQHEVSPGLIRMHRASSTADLTLVCCGMHFASLMALTDHVAVAHQACPQQGTNRRERRKAARAERRSSTTTRGVTHSKLRGSDQTQHSRDTWDDEKPGNASEEDSATGDGVKLGASTTPDGSGHTNSGTSSIKKPSIGLNTESTSSTWLPLGVREMGDALHLDVSAGETFTWQFLTKTLGDNEWSPGFFWVPVTDILPKGAYWLLEADFEPFVPTLPGHHGAKLTAIFNSPVATSDPQPDDFMDVPLFLRAKGAAEYVYLGNYSQTRFSDRLDYDTLMGHVSKEVRQHWANLLADPKRPDWVTEALKNHFWPIPLYNGRFTPANVKRADGKDDESNDTQTSFRDAMMYMRDLSEWERSTRRNIGCINAGTIMDAFERADTDEPPGLRMYWEYLECIGYDKNLYARLVHMKRSQQATGSAICDANNVAKEAVNGTVDNLAHRLAELANVDPPASEPKTPNPVATKLPSSYHSWSPIARMWRGDDSDIARPTLTGHHSTHIRTHNATDTVSPENKPGRELTGNSGQQYNNDTEKKEMYTTAFCG